jgi:hypothetical protein
MIRDVQHRIESVFPHDSFISNLVAALPPGSTDIQEQQRQIRNVVLLAVREAFQEIEGILTPRESPSHKGNDGFQSDSEHGPEVRQGGPMEQPNPMPFSPIPGAFNPMDEFTQDGEFSGLDPGTDEGYTTKPGTETSAQICPTDSAASPFDETGYDATLSFFEYVNDPCWAGQDEDTNTN